MLSYTLLRASRVVPVHVVFFFFQAEDGIRDVAVTGVQTCALPISETHGHIPGAVADAPRNEREQRVGHRLLEAGDRGHAGEADREVVDRLGGKLERWNDGKREQN